jgi:Zinc-binding dehydrogenase
MFIDNLALFIRIVQRNGLAAAGRDMGLSPTTVSIASLVDAGKIKTTLAKNLGRINAANLKNAHAQLESGTACGKIVLEGF